VRNHSDSSATSTCMRLRACIETTYLMARRASAAEHSDLSRCLETTLVHYHAVRSDTVRRSGCEVDNPIAPWLAIVE
jgi:hypothetical protein